MIRANTYTQAALEAAPDAVVVVNGEGTIAWANATCTAMLGYPPNELCGKQVACLLPPQYGDTQQRSDMLLRLARSSRSIGGPEVTVLSQTGELVEVGLAASCVEVDQKACVVLSFRDERHRRDREDLSGLQHAALQSAANGVVITDVGGTVVWANPAFSRLTGYLLHEILGRNTRMFRSGKHDAAFYANLWQTIRSGRTWSGDIINRRKDGTLYHEEQTITPVFGPGRLVTHFIAIKQDVTERRRTEDELRQARIDLAARLAEIQLLNAKLHAEAIRDPLTGLFNRRYFDETVARELARLQRSGLPLGIAALDVDHFKRINDGHGHAFGDEVLRNLADTLRSSVRVSDVPCRFGGEEFVVAMPGAPEQIAVQRAEQWRQAVENLKMCANGGSVATTVSIGVAVWSGGQESLDAALLRADGALYEAKQTGRNRVVVWHAGCRVPSLPPAWDRPGAVAPKPSAAAERSD